MNDAESALERIWAKWTSHPVLSSIQDQCKQACEPIGELLAGLTEMNMGTGNMPRAEAESLGARAGEIVSHFARATFMVGLEYGSKETTEITLDKVIQRAKDALPLLEAASGRTTKLGLQLISGAAASGAINPGKVDWLAQQFGKIQVSSAAKCFRIGMEYSGAASSDGATNRLGGAMSTSQSPKTAEEVFAAVQLMWTADQHQAMQPADMMVSMLYEMFGESSPGLDAKGRGLLRTINNLEAELIRLEHKFMALNSALSAIMFALSANASSDDKVTAAKRFIVSLDDFYEEFLKSVQDSHAMTMDLRKDLKADTSSSPS